MRHLQPCNKSRTHRHMLSSFDDVSSFTEYRVGVMSLSHAVTKLELDAQGANIWTLPLQAMVEEDLERLIDWDDNDVQEATGNEGATFGRLDMAHTSPHCMVHPAHPTDTNQNLCRLLCAGK